MSQPGIETYFKEKRPVSEIEKWFNKEIFDWKIFHNRHKKYEALGIYRDNVLIGTAAYL